MNSKIVPISILITGVLISISIFVAFNLYSKKSPTNNKDIDKEVRISPTITLTPALTPIITNKRTNSGLLKSYNYLYSEAEKIYNKAKTDSDATCNDSSKPSTLCVQMTMLVNEPLIEMSKLSIVIKCLETNPTSDCAVLRSTIDEAKYKDSVVRELQGIREALTN